MTLTYLKKRLSLLMQNAIKKYVTLFNWVSITTKLFLSLSVFFCTSIALADGFERQVDTFEQYQANRLQSEKDFVGRDLWILLNRESCSTVKIYSRPDSHAQVYVSDNPINVAINGFVAPFADIRHYYQIKLPNGKLGYISTDVLNYINPGDGKYKRWRNSEFEFDNNYETLTTDCFFDLPPEQLQDRIDKIVATKQAEDEAKKQKELVEKQASDDAKQKAQEEHYKQTREIEIARQQELANKAEYLKREAPEILKKMDNGDFCMTYGRFLRGDRIDKVGALENIAPYVNKEVARRKLSFNKTLIREERIRIGMSECELYAAWGFPKSNNRSAGSWGIHIQHLYGDWGPYVYTENGRVTSWQDAIPTH